MKSPKARLVMLVLDGIALIGLVIFSVGAALNRDNNIYLAGQIVCIVWVLVAVLLLWQTNGQNHTTEEESDES